MTPMPVTAKTVFLMIDNFMFPSSVHQLFCGNRHITILTTADIQTMASIATGIGVIILYAISGNANDYHMTRMVAAILISFGCYLPVTLFSKTKPKVGLLMIPKTCAYMWVIAMGLQLLF